MYGDLREKKESSGMIFIFDPQCHTLVTFFLNLPKCNMMQLTRKHLNKIQASYILEGAVLENVDNIKYLGVTITNDLKWNTHISNICTKANRTLGFLR